MIAIPMNVAVNAADIKLNVNTGQHSVPVGIGAQYSVQVSYDYNLLTNKPQINGREVVGNQTVAYYLQDGLIINGGDATGVT